MDQCDPLDQLSKTALIAELRAARDELTARVDTQATDSQALHQFASGVAHEFNNMMMVVMGSVSVAQHTLAPDTPALKDLQRALAACRAGRDLTQSLLTFAGKAPYDPKPLALNDVVLQAVEAHRGALPAGVSVQVDAAAPNTTFRGDAQLLTLVVDQLCLNATHAMAGQGVLSLRVTSDPTHVRLVVADTGHGMTPNVQAHLFEPFFSTRDTRQGTGLGLSKVHGAVLQHGGTIQVESKPGQGSTFTLTFPAMAPETEASAPQQAQTPPKARQQTLLLVEDEVGVRYTGNAVLRHLGYRVLLAESGAQAIEIYKAQACQIDLVLLDLAMPIMSGDAVFATLQGFDPTVRVVVCSGRPKNDLIDRLLKQGAVGFIQKPYSLQSLNDDLDLFLPR